MAEQAKIEEEEILQAEQALFEEKEKLKAEEEAKLKADIIVKAEGGTEQNSSDSSSDDDSPSSSDDSSSSSDSDSSDSSSSGESFDDDSSEDHFLDNDEIQQLTKKIQKADRLMAEIIGQEGDEETAKQSKKYKQLQKKKHGYQQEIHKKRKQLRALKRKQNNIEVKHGEGPNDKTTETAKNTKKKKKKVPIKKKKKKMIDDDFDIEAFRARARKAFEETKAEIDKELESKEGLNKSQAISVEEWAKQIQNQVKARTHEDGKELLKWQDEFYGMKKRMNEIDALLKSDAENEDLLKEKTALEEKMELRHKDYVQFCIDMDKNGRK